MDLRPYFEAQKKLDEHITQQKGLQGQDLLDKKILALQVELGELAQEWRGFKFWSEDQEPITNIGVKCVYCYGEGHMNHDEVFEGGDPFPCKECNGSGVSEYKNALLEEYVDCLHFILSIGLDIELTIQEHVKWRRFTVVYQFNDLFGYSSDLFKSVDEDWTEDERFNAYEELLAGFLGLGEMLGFTEQQIHDAYFDKNKVNHERQANGY